MSPTFTEDDIGKTVESASGENLGVVIAVDSGTSYVEPNPGVTDSIKAALDWEGDADDAIPLADDAVDRVTDETIRLEAEFPTESITTGDTDDDAETPADDAEEREVGHAPGEPVASDPTDPETDVDGTGNRAGTGGPDDSEPMMEDDEFYDTAEDGPRVDPSEEMEPPEETDQPEAGERTDEPSAEEMESIEDEASHELEVDPTELTDQEPEAEITADEDVGQREGSTDPAAEDEPDRREESGRIRDEDDASTDSTTEGADDERDENQ
ncbi:MULTISPECIES: prolipoprotein diacylglyceryl transferase [Natrialbaceae]|uniref:hypothetical protein n=1 Tax=Natrialbaceae TaxID=1644061 RepID=UPI00207D54E9|nr:hypothetical protein [Natronococcus sp. CG52]